MITKEIYESTYPKEPVADKTIVVGMAGSSGSKSGGKANNSGKPKSKTASANRSSSQGRQAAVGKASPASRSKSAGKANSAHRTGKTGKAGGVKGRTTYYKTKQSKQRRKLKFLMLAVALLLVLAMLRSCFLTVDIENLHYPDYIQQNFIAVDGHSRTGNKMSKVNDIVIHYVANPGSSAKANRDYFASSQSRVSAHFVVGLNGEVIQCIPLDEESSASNRRNPDTISIEVCHPDKSGRFNDKTYGALIQLAAWLCNEFHLDEEHLIRHYDVTGKNCPKYYVDHPSAWKQLKEDVGRYR